MTAKINVLIVEDDASLRLTLTDILSDEGFQVSATDSCNGANLLLREKSFQLAILDLMLPDGNGYELCRRLRASGLDLPILMLTARSLEDDLVKGFNSGADDYLVKPYRSGELLARVRSLLKRSRIDTNSDGRIHINGYHLNREARTIKTREGQSIDLTPKEFDLLLYLWDNPQRAHSRDQILSQVWGLEVVVDPRTIDNFISSLKKKLELHAGNPVHIETVRGIGYRLER